ncbi:MAG: class I SAM-dependent methyltransferase [Acidimicrobiia bacterium]|nr:class I SAM-dependent methyltransferase [Acidimicrobiia bacterium]MYF83260.1 class I SAM-dependent methyltransferase [Acidimicrobiia bacterium]
MDHHLSMPARHEQTDDWDGMAGWWMTEADDPAYREEVGPLFLQVLRPRSGQVLLDLGCGEGRIGERLAAQGVRVVGVDVNLELARLASGRHPVFLRRLPDLACVRDEAVDGAYAVLALEHLEDSWRFFAETARVTRSGGSLTIVINHPLYTAPGSGPVIDPTDGELFWRFGDYLSEGRTREPAGDRSVQFIHRPIGTLLTQAATAGWSLEAALEQGVGSRAASRDPILAQHGDIPHLMALRWLRR